MINDIITSITIMIVLLFSLKTMQKFSILSHLKLSATGINVSAIVGTPIHELSHAALCVIGGHHITKISLFKPSKDGTLGFVEHSYNTGNILIVAANLPIALAPIAGGCMAITGMNTWLLPDAELNELLRYASQPEVLGITSICRNAITTVIKIFDVLSTQVTSGNLVSVLLWIYLVGSISLHMTPSSADFHNCRIGLTATGAILSLFFLFIPNETASVLLYVLNIFISLLMTGNFVALLTLTVSLITTGIIRLIFNR